MQTAHRIFFMDAMDMTAVDSQSIGLVVTSPPYPIIDMWDPLFSRAEPRICRTLAQFDGDRAFELMHQWLDDLWAQIDRVLIPGGIACINIGDAVRTFNGEFRLFPNHARIISAFGKLNCTMLPSILWRKPTNAPNKFMGSGMLPPNAYVTLEHEYILIFRKKGKRTWSAKEEKQQRYSSAFFWEERNQWFSDIWFDLPGSNQALNNKALRARSGAFPFELPYRLINMFSLKNDVVLDPFLGTGTTMLAAMCAGRSSIGYEIEKDFQSLILQRITTVPSLARQTIDNRLKAHLDFMQNWIAANKIPKYHNPIYDLPVITRQEVALQFEQAEQVEYLTGDQFKVTYRPTCKENLPGNVSLKKAGCGIEPTAATPKQRGRQLDLF